MTITQLEWITTKNVILNPNHPKYLKYIPKEKDLQYPIYMLETNFSMSCSIMPWLDDKVRLLSHIEFSDDDLDISGTRTLRPLGIFN